MKVVCSKDTLLKGIGIVLGAVSQKSTLPLLSNLLFDAKGNNLTLAATDLEVAVKTIIPAQVLKEGGTTLPGKLVSDIVRKFDSSEIEVSSDEQEKILIKSGKTKFSLVGIPKTEFPVAINFEGGKSFTIETSVLKDMIIKTKFAISTDETRYVLNGIYFVIEKGRAIMVATDGKRLAFISNDDVVDKKLSFSLIIPSKAIEELLKGLTPVDVTAGYFTSINEGVKLNSISITNGVAYVDFDSKLEYQVGGSCRIMGIYAQIEETLKQFTTINSVVISIDGRTGDILQP